MRKALIIALGLAKFRVCDFAGVCRGAIKLHRK